MISARKLRANRANARASTGPQTATGKGRVARNAHRHGLTLSVLADPALAAEGEVLAREIAGEGASVERHELARRIAEVQIDLVRVRRARHQLLSRALSDPNYQSPAALKRKDALVVHLARTLGPALPVPLMFSAMLLANPEGPDKFVIILSDVAAQVRDPRVRCGAGRRRLVFC